MRVAVGTSLVVIALKSFSGFFKYLDVLADLEIPLDWETVGWFIAIGMVGILGGHWIGTRLNHRALQRTFAVFLVAMAAFVLYQEIPKILPKTSAGTSSDACGQAARRMKPAATSASQPAMYARPPRGTIAPRPFTSWKVIT